MADQWRTAYRNRCKAVKDSRDSVVTGTGCASMKELVDVIAKALVDNPNEVVVTESLKGDDTLIELKVAASDMGKVIGKQGRIAKAIRSVVKAAASKEDKKVIVEIQ